MGDLPAGVVTFLFTDIESSTRLFRRLGDDYLPVLERHNELLRRAWANHHGAEVKTEGDAFFVAFASAADAVSAAVEAQEHLASERWPGGLELRVRMGIHTGLASPHQGDYVAYAVHQAARVVGAAHGGQVLLTAETKTLVDQEGYAGQIGSLGRYRIRDFDDHVELFSAGFAGAPAQLPPVRAVPAMGHNLVSPTTSLVGREAELEQLEAAVGPGRLITVIGPGGAGKTRLATELGLRTSPSWVDGVWMVELAGIPVHAGATPVAAAVADAIGIAVGSSEPLDAIIENWRDRSALIVLDNCEHVVAGAADIAERLLAEMPAVGVLATSREPLGIGRERTWRLNALEPGDSGAELFVQRAAAVNQGYEPDAADLPIIRAICERLDGIPLAIELAAARADVMTPRAILDGLDDRFRLLRSRRRDLDPRQQSLDALLDWEVDLMTEPDRAVFRRLAVFASGFGFESAEHAVSDDSLPRPQVTDGIWRLVDKSLIYPVATAGETRFRMPETVHEYAGRLIVDETERRQALHRLGEWYLDAAGPWKSSDVIVRVLAQEANNLRAAIVGLAGAEPETAQLLAISLAFAHDISGTVREGISEIEALVDKLPLATINRAVLLGALCRMYFRAGRSDIEEVIDEAERLVAESGPEPEWAAGTIGVIRATWLAATGNLTSAIELASDAARTADTDLEAARWYNTLGLFFSRSGDTAAAADAFRRGLQAEERLGDTVSIAVAHNNLAEQDLRAGRLTQAAEHQLHTLVLASEIGSRSLVALSCIIAARLAAAAGSWSEAASLHSAAERLLAESGLALEGDDAALSEEMMREARDHGGDRFNEAVLEGHGWDITRAIDAARATLAAARSV